jgi:hypothetical protein
MSYCRWNDECDVYVYEDCRGGWTTSVTSGEDYNDPTPGDCADTLEKLREEGKKVPQYAIDELREEQAGVVKCS